MTTWIILFILPLIFQVRPQFDISVATAPPVRRGRRKCQSATSILDSCSQLSRKNSVCKFPQLLFKTGSKDQTQQPKGISNKKAIESTDVGRKPAEKRRTVSAAQCSNLPKGSLPHAADDTSSHQRCLAEPDRPSVQVSERCRIPAVCASTLPCEEFSTTEVSSVSPPPDVDTPKAMEERNISPSTPCGHLLLAQPCTPPCNGSPDILVADTPERDYGMKVTWRRRKNLMVLLKQRGHLSEADALIQS